MNKYIYTESEPIYYILCSFNKLKLDKNDLILLFKIGFCPCCLKILFDKTISDKELEYINWKDWDDFLDKYPMRLNQCNCTRCECGLNKILDIHYDLFDIENKNPICFLSCTKCNKLTIPIVDKVKTVETVETVETVKTVEINNKYKRIYSDIENNDFNKNKKSNKNVISFESKENNITNICNISNQLICG